MAKLYFYYSSMNAGKSTILLQSSYNYQERGMNTLLFTPAIDTRFKKNTVSSRIGINAAAIGIDENDNLYDITKQKQTTDTYACILIDEAQFLTREQVSQLTEITDKLSIPVLAYGLRTDFRGELFTGSQFLLAWADELIEIKTICHCGRKAIMNMRINEQGLKVKYGDQVMIGGNESYISTCRQHFKSGESKSHKSEVKSFKTHNN